VNPPVGGAAADEALVADQRAAPQALGGQDVPEYGGVGRVERPEVEREIGVEALRRHLHVLRQQVLDLRERAGQEKLRRWR
jgi:hypothetical protein